MPGGRVYCEHHVKAIVDVIEDGVLGLDKHSSSYPRINWEEVWVCGSETDGDSGRIYDFS